MRDAASIHACYTIPNQGGHFTALRRWLFAAVAGSGALLLAGCAGTGATASKPAAASQGSQGAGLFASREHAVQLQIFLDGRNFGPGVVDGRPGEFTGKALARYNEANGLAPGAEPDVSAIRAYTIYTITPEDLTAVGTMAVKPEELAKQKRLPYTSLTELLGERFHTTQEFLRQLNAGKNIDTLAAGETVMAPNVEKPFRTDAYPSDYPKSPASVAKSRHVVVDLQAKMLEVREGERLVAAFPITPGSTEHPAPVGEWKVAGVAPWPWYRYDEGVLERGERTEVFYNFPPGPNSPVGVLWTQLNRPGIGIHGTGSPETIGRSGSHGCIRLANWDAATFYTLVRTGMAVTIQ